MKPLKAEKMWVVQGPAGGVAPAYGIAFTRKRLLEDRAGAVPAGCRCVRVMVMEWPDWMDYQTRVRPRP